MKNIVICCDGTGNEIKENMSNVLKLSRVCSRGVNQLVYYDPGVGTINNSSSWSRVKTKFKGVFGLATGYGLDENVLSAYQFLVENYNDGDLVFLFGFSRGAYSVRVLAGFVHLVGLLNKSQLNLIDYAYLAYKKCRIKGDLKYGWRFKDVCNSRQVPIEFIGVWDTVSSVLVPRKDRFYIPSTLSLPYTKKNPSVKAYRHAMAIDEKRRMFRLFEWKDNQFYKPDRLDPSTKVKQNCKQMWFAGVHSDIGGGYPESESGLAKISLQWMIEEAKPFGLNVMESDYNEIVLGNNSNGNRLNYVAPNPIAKIHNSMKTGWKPLEWVPKRAKYKEHRKRKSVMGLYLPRSEPREIDPEALIHESVNQRLNAESLDPRYQPVNLDDRGIR